MSKYDEHYSERTSRDEEKRTHRRASSYDRQIVHKRMDVEMRLSEAWERDLMMFTKNTSPRALHPV